MRAVIQRVAAADVQVPASGYCAGIQKGLLVLLGVADSDTLADCEWMARKLLNLRIFEDKDGKMNLSLAEAQAVPAVLMVSQFTLLGDCRKGNRPSFAAAAAPEKAQAYYEKVADLMRQQGITVATGQFAARMLVSLVNDGPVTIILDTPGQEH